MLSFRLELAHELMGGFTSRQRKGRPRNVAHAQLHRLANTHTHWPILVQHKGNCVVWLATLKNHNLPTVGNRHESKVKREDCGVHLCVAGGRDCFKCYHMTVDYAR